MIAGSGRRGGHSRRGAKAQTPVEEKELESGDRKNRKPEIEHYIPKKVQEKSELDEKGKPPDEGQKGNFQDGGGGGPGTGKKNRKKKAKHKAHSDPPINSNEGPEIPPVGADNKGSQTGKKPAADKPANQTVGGEGKRREERPAPLLNDDISLRKVGEGGGRQQQHQMPGVGKMRQENNWRAQGKEFRPSDRQSAHKGDTQQKASESSLISAGTKRSDKVDMVDNKSRGEQRSGPETGSRQRGRNDETHHPAFSDMDNQRRGWGSSKNDGVRDAKNLNYQQERFDVERIDTNQGVRKSKSEFWDRRDQTSDGHNYRSNHNVERRSEPKENGYDRRQTEGAAVSKNWSRGDQASWSRHSSPTRSSRGSSPTNRYLHSNKKMKHFGTVKDHTSATF